MFTKCANPQCRGVYSITTQHLRLAMGMVRCPRCRTVFNALSTVQDPTAEEAAEVEQITRQLPYAQMGDRIVLSHRTAKKQTWYKKLKDSEAAAPGQPTTETPTQPETPKPRRRIASADEPGEPDERKQSDLDAAVAAEAASASFEEMADGVDAPARSATLAMLGDLELAIRNILRQWRRSGFGMIAIVFGVVAIILAGGFINHTLWTLREGTIQSQLGHIQVVKSEFFELGLSDPYAYLLPAQAPILDTLKQYPDVEAVAPRLGFSGLIAAGDISVSFIAEGVVPERELIVSRRLAILRGEGLTSDAPNGIILGKGLAANLGVDVGDPVVLLATTEAGYMNAVEANVRGIFVTSKKAFDDVALRVPLSMAQQLLQVDGVHKWVVLLDETEKTGEIVERLRAQHPGSESGLEVVPWLDLADFFKKSSTLLSAQMKAVQLIIAIIIVVSISNTLAMSVVERTGEIGTLMALGFRRKRVLTLFLSEGAVLGVFGGLVGVGLGVALGALLSHIGIPMPPPPGTDVGFTAEIMVTVPLSVTALVVAFAATLLASVYPARRASQLEIVDALRHAR